jgi:ribonuclease BN (tRNA processing enzyme)
MGARILFLGTGGDAFVMGKQMRASAGLILNFESNQFHIDPGPGALVMAKMLGLNLRENTAIFISGNDIFRANDANAVISAMTYDGMDKKGVLVCPSSVTNLGNKDKDPFVNTYYKNCLEKTIIVDNTRKLAINDIDIEIVELDSPINEACGFKFITPKFSIGYIPDTSFKAELGDSFHNTDILIINVQDPRSSKRKEHINSEDAEKIIRKANPQIAIITGFGLKMFQADPLYEAREIQRDTGIQVIAAKDGMTINPMSFTTAVRQKNLGSLQ